MNIHKKCQEKIATLKKQVDQMYDAYHKYYCPYVAYSMDDRTECSAFGSYIIELKAANVVPRDNWASPCLIDEAQTCPLFIQKAKGGFPRINFPPEIKGPILLSAMPCFDDTTSDIAKAMKKWREDVRH